MKALKEDIKRKGDLPIVLAKRMAEIISRTINETPNNQSINWLTLNKEIEKLVHQASGKHYLKELCLNAGKSFLQEYPKNTFVLFGTGSNDIVYARQGEVAKSIQSMFPGRSNLYRVPIRFSYSNTHRKNKITRARGVVFTLLGSACAYLMGQRELCIYENGIGAINLPYRASALGLDHSRSVHPLTLLMVSDIMSELLGETFRVRNPFLFWTKAQMCQSLAEDKRNDLSSLTQSCDRPHRQQPNQCGYCCSCLLRRQALAASKIKDCTSYVILHGKKPKKDPSIYLRHMLNQVHTFESLLNTSDNRDLQWEELTRKFPILDDIVDRVSTAESLSIPGMRTSLLQLYQNYVTEWREVESQLRVGLLDIVEQQPLSKSCSITL